MNAPLNWQQIFWALYHNSIHLFITSSLPEQLNNPLVPHQICVKKFPTYGNNIVPIGVNTSPLDMTTIVYTHEKSLNHISLQNRK